jgi:hypothetical protein
MAQPSEDPDRYRLPWEARAGRWWRRRRELIGLILLCGVTLVAFVAGNWQLGAGLGAVTLLYIAYAYTNWFNG